MAPVPSEIKMSLCQVVDKDGMKEDPLLQLLSIITIPAILNADAWYAALHFYLIRLFRDCWTLALN